MRLRRLIPIALGLAAGLLAAPAGAAVVKGVQTGTTTMSPNPRTVAITTVDPAKAFVVCSHRTGDSKDGNLPTCELGASSITITSGKADAATTVRWTVVEFESGVSVQRGTATYGSSQPTMNVGLSAVDLAKSFALISVRTSKDSDEVDEEWTTRARLTSATNLELSRLKTGSAPVVAWQVVQMDGAAVQRGLATIASGSASITAPIAAVDTATSFLVMSRRAASGIGGVEPDYQVRGELTSSTMLTFTRTGTNQSVDVAWAVVSLADGSAVQRGTAATPSTATATMDAALSPVDTARSVAFISVSGGGDKKTLHETSWTTDFTSSSNLQLERVTTGGTHSQVAWFVVQFFRCTATVANPDYVAATAQSGQVTVYWASPSPALILRKAAPFLGEKPQDGQAYAVNDPIGAATVVYNGAVAETSFTQTGLTNGTTYYYRVFPKIAGPAPCYASGTVVDPTPAAGPHPAWSYTMEGGSMLRAGIAGDGTVHASSNASRIIALETTGGLQSWAPVKTSAPIQATLTWLPVSGATAVFGGDQSGRAYRVDVSVGTKTWEVALAGTDAVQAGIAAQLRGYSDAAFQATYDDDVLFVATRNTSTTNNKVFALRASDGAILWTFNGAGAYAMDYIVGMPWVDYGRNRLYVASRAGAGGTQASFWVIDTLTGGLLASLALGHLETSPTLSYDGMTVYVGSTTGNLHAVDAGTLAAKWTAPSALGTAIKGFLWEDWMVTGRLYFSTADGNVWSLQDPGPGSPPDPLTPVWKTAVPGASTPLLLDALYVGSSDGRLYQLGPGTGVVETQVTVGDGTRTVGDVSTETGSEVFVGTTAGKLYEFPLPLP